MNSVTQTVTFCADPQFDTYGDNKSRVTFNGAVKKRFKKNENDPDNFFQYVAFGATADFINKYFKKGSKALIMGEINNNNYEKDGVKHYGQQILINNIEFFGSKSDNNVSAKPDDNKTSNSTTAAPASSNTESSSVAEYDEYADF